MVTNLTFLKNNTEGDREKMAKYIKMYLRQAALLVEEMKTSFENEKWDELHRAAHTLRPLVNYMGIESINENIRLIEKSAKERTHLRYLAPLIKEVEQVCNVSFDEMREYLSEVGHNPDAP